MAATPSVGVLLAQLGTPDEPTPAALKPYLRQFLSDPRVVERPRWFWLPILYLGIVPFRSGASAKKYARIWSEETGSPLLFNSERQRDLLAESLGHGYVVELGMRYGEPSIDGAVTALLEKGCERIVVLPLYPQYAASSTGSVYDEVFRAAAAHRFVPALHFVPPYYADDGYIRATSDRVLDAMEQTTDPIDHILFSFHGLPVKMVERGDPYQRQCEETAGLLAERLKLDGANWSLVYQSQFGPEEWLGPKTDARLAELARNGAKRVLVAAPGFTADCLETLDEIGNESAAAFRAAGGEKLLLAPCLNELPSWIAALRELVVRAAHGP